MIEYFVYIDANDPPKDLVVVAADIPDGVSRVVVKPHELPSNWRQVPAPPGLAAIGDSFAGQRKSAVLVLPSALVPSESNWLINPRHPESAEIKRRPAEPFQYDARFFAVTCGSILPVRIRKKHSDSPFRRLRIRDHLDLGRRACLSARAPATFRSSKAHACRGRRPCPPARRPPGRSWTSLPWRRRRPWAGPDRSVCRMPACR